MTLQRRALLPRVLPEDVNSLVVTQDNDFAGSIQTMTLTEKRCLLLAAAVIRQADVTLPSVRFYASDYRRLFGINNNGLVKELLGVVDSITTRNIVIPHGRSGKTSFSVVGRFSVTPGTDSEDGRAYVDIALHGDMAEFFLGLSKNFFSLPLLVYSTFRSNYALRIGEILASSGRGDNQYTVTFDVNDLKEKLDCGHYSNFAQFRRRVLEPAQRENNEIGFLSFDWQEHRSGRAISQLSFTVTLNRNAWSAEREREDIGRIALDNKLRLQLQQLGFHTIPQGYAEVLGNDQVRAILEDTLREVEKRKGSGRSIKNPGAYLRARLDAAMEHARGMLPLTNPEVLSNSGSTGQRRLASSQELYKLSDLLNTTLNAERLKYAQSVYDALDQEQREDLTALVLEDAFASFPRLLSPVQKPKAGHVLDENVRYLATIRLMEEQGLLNYEGALASPCAYADRENLFSEFYLEERQRIIAQAESDFLD